MKKLCILTLLLTFNPPSFAETISPTLQDSIATYFNEIKVEANKYQQLWGTDLYGSILLVNPNTRQIFANFSDINGILKKDSQIYSGILPKVRVKLLTQSITILPIVTSTDSLTKPTP